jgi:rubredoxin
MTGESHDNQGEAVPLNWACTNCGYRAEGELPEKCPECGEGRNLFSRIPPASSPYLALLPRLPVGSLFHLPSTSWGPP